MKRMTLDAESVMTPEVIVASKQYGTLRAKKDKLEVELEKAKQRSNELQEQVSAMKEKLISLEETKNSQSYNMELIYSKLKEVREEMQARFEENLKALHQVENEQLVESKADASVLEERVRLGNEKILLLTEKTEAMEKFMVDLLLFVGKAASSSSTPSAASSSSVSTAQLVSSAPAALHSASKPQQAPTLSTHSLNTDGRQVTPEIQATLPSQDTSLDKIIKGIRHNSLRKVVLVNTKLKSEHVIALADALKRNTTVVSVDFDGSTFPVETPEIIAAALQRNRSVTSISLRDCGLQPPAIVAFAEMLAGHPSIKSCAFSGNRLEGMGVGALCSVVLGGNNNATPSVLTTLELSFTSIGAEGVCHIVKVLKEGKSSITSLDLQETGMGDKGAVAIGSLLRSAPPLKVLKLQDNGIREEGIMSIAEALAVNEQLTYLDLTRNEITARAAASLRKALNVNKSLLELGLAGGALEPASGITLANVLKKNNSLTSLNLWGNSVGAGKGALSLSKWLARNSSVAVLNLRGTDLGPEGAAELAAALERNPACGIHTLDLSGNKLGAEGARTLLRSFHRSLPSLKTLWLGGNHMGDDGLAAAITLLPDASQSSTSSPAPPVMTIQSSFQFLSLQLNVISDNGAWALAAALATPGSARNLHTLDLSWNHIGPNGARFLADYLRGGATSSPSSSPPPLSSLILEGNRIGSEGARYICEALEENTNLLFLNLSSCNLRRSGAYAVGLMLKRSGALEELVLKRNGFGSEGARAIAEGIKRNTVLKKINLDENRFESEGVVAIAEALKLNTSLTVVELQGNAMREEGVAALKEAMTRNPRLTCKV
ncbi:RNA-DNA hybrid ribonuclease [Balamuthia mandrillaris]